MIENCKTIAKEDKRRIAQLLQLAEPIEQTIKLYKRMISFLTKLDDEINILKYLTYYNLGLLQYAVGNFDIGVHNIEIAYKLIVEKVIDE